MSAMVERVRALSREGGERIFVSTFRAPRAGLRSFSVSPLNRSLRKSYGRTLYAHSRHDHHA